MLRAAVLFVCLVLCHSHAVVPLVPAVHSVHTAPLLAPYGYHGFAGHGLYGHGLYGHGLIGKSFGHHLLKRSPHYLAPLAHVGHVAAVAPLAVSHQSRVDVHHASPVVAPVLPVIKPVVAPVVAAPLLHKSLIAAPYGVGLSHHGLGHYAGVYPHLAHGLY